VAVGDIVPVPGAQFEETLASASPDMLREMTAPRGALLYSRFSREEFGGYSWL